MNVDVAHTYRTVPDSRGKVNKR